MPLCAPQHAALTGRLVARPKALAAGARPHACGVRTPPPPRSAQALTTARPCARGVRTPCAQPRAPHYVQWRSARRARHVHSGGGAPAARAHGQGCAQHHRHISPAHCSKLPRAPAHRARTPAAGHGGAARVRAGRAGTHERARSVPAPAVCAEHTGWQQPRCARRHALVVVRTARACGAHSGARAARTARRVTAVGFEPTPLRTGA